MNTRAKKWSKKNLGSQKQIAIQVYLSKWVEQMKIKFSLHFCIQRVADYILQLSYLIFSWYLSTLFTVQASNFKNPFMKSKSQVHLFYTWDNSGVKFGMELKWINLYFLCRFFSIAMPKKIFFFCHSSGNINWGWKSIIHTICFPTGNMDH